MDYDKSFALVAKMTIEEKVSMTPPLVFQSEKNKSVVCKPSKLGMRGSWTVCSLEI